jgi:hypothetical protein
MFTLVKKPIRKTQQISALIQGGGKSKIHVRRLGVTQGENRSTEVVTVGDQRNVSLTQGGTVGRVLLSIFRKAW